MTIFDLALQTNDRAWFNSLVNTIEEDITEEELEPQQAICRLINGAEIKIVHNNPVEFIEKITYEDFLTVDTKGFLYALERNVKERGIKIYPSVK